MELSAGRGKGGGIARQKKEGVSYPTVVHPRGFVCACACVCVFGGQCWRRCLCICICACVCVCVHDRSPKSIFTIFSSPRCFA